MKNFLRTGWLLALVVAASWVSVSAITVADQDAKALFEDRCSLCHPTSRPLSVTKTAEEWRQTVMRMKGKAGERISDQEAETIINYLSKIRGK